MTSKKDDKPTVVNTGAPKVTPPEPKPANGIDYDAIGQAAYVAFEVATGGDDVQDGDAAWAKLADASRDTWVAAGRAAVEAYDRQLTDQADRKAEQAFADAQRTAEADADALRSQAENPADAFAKAKAIEDAQGSTTTGS
jgi:hypothetical protein